MITQHGGYARGRRAIVLATVTALALTAVQPTLAVAGGAPSDHPSAAALKDTGPTDVSARRRHHHYRGGGGGAAAAAAFAGIVGTGLAIAAEQNRRSYYEDHYGYYGHPGYYGPGPYYYGGGPYYGYGGGW